MRYTFNSKTNCFATYVEQYETKVNEAGEEEQVLIPCKDRLYTQTEVNDFLSKCNEKRILKAVNGLPMLVDRYTDEEFARISALKRIADLKAKLQATDYMANKVIDGDMTAEEYEPIRLQRKAWREEINAIEVTL